MSTTEQDEQPEAQLLQVTTADGVVAQDVIAKVNAGAALLFAIYHHPRAKELLTSDFGTVGLTKAYGQAQEAYGIGGRR